ncbi:MAG: SpoIVB sporulation stage IV peptidase [Thermoanaerobacterales bacterium 50_218]|nr:MAG: SpoIVB sporulation stage IV peptidase [Thermoanaerobacterales bacterium 50_218]
MISASLRRQLLGLLFFFFLGIASFLLVFQSFLSIPSHYRVSVGEKVDFGISLPPQISDLITVYVRGSEKASLKWQSGGLPIALAPGHISLELRIFNFLPLKRVTVEVVPTVKVVAGGHSIGVLLQRQGVFVVGYAAISSSDGKKYCPAKEAGIEPGDLILEVGGTPVHSDTQVSLLIDQLAKKKEVLEFKVKHQGKVHCIFIKPRYCPQTKRYRIGLYVRDGTAGMGTLTFYDPQTKRYGALGHPVLDPDTNLNIEVEEGRIVEASVQGIQQGRRGHIGEKLGFFVNRSKISGSIEKNSKFGIFGKLEQNLRNPIFPEPLPVALSTSQIREGPAEILTVLEGEKIESFQAEIQTVFIHPKLDGKAFVLKITDPLLLERTGGIIQGMSGSPVIQDGKLVGAVTHVFINDPTRGFGVLAGLMLEEAELIPDEIGQSSSGLNNFLGDSFCNFLVVFASSRYTIGQSLP